MFLENYYSETGEQVRFSRQQASDFAKDMAGDFNPIHDQDAKRFCVPGDLLFSLVLKKYGLSKRMQFTFAGMVTDDIPVLFPESTADRLTIADAHGKEYLSIQRQGDRTTDQDLIRDLTSSYVEFSGQTFPHILIPLMATNNVMINPDRPLVIYESMLIDMTRLDVTAPKLELTGSRLDVEGKRGNVCLTFHLTAAGEIIGKGEKNMVLSGLRSFEQEKVELLVHNYNSRKQAYGN